MWEPIATTYYAGDPTNVPSTLLFIPTQTTTAEQLTTSRIPYRYAEFWGYKTTGGTVNAAAVFLGYALGVTPWQVDPAGLGTIPLISGQSGGVDVFDLSMWWVKSGTSGDGILVKYWP